METEKAEKMTAEEILNKHGVAFVRGTMPDHFIDAMHEYAEQRVREELMKYTQFITSREFPYTICNNGLDKPFITTWKDHTIEEIVDEYLNQRKK